MVVVVMVAIVVDASVVACLVIFACMPCAKVGAGCSAGRGSSRAHSGDARGPRVQMPGN